MVWTEKEVRTIIEQQYDYWIFYGQGHFYDYHINYPIEELEKRLYQDGKTVASTFIGDADEIMDDVKRIMLDNAQIIATWLNSNYQSVIIYGFLSEHIHGVSVSINTTQIECPRKCAIVLSKIHNSFQMDTAYPVT